MLYWLAPVLAGAGYFAWRSWRRDLAIKSGELMDVRDLMPEGGGHLELRALQSRLYRVELQFELVPDPSPDGVRIEETSELELSVHRILTGGEFGLDGAAATDDLVHRAHHPVGLRVQDAVRAGLASEGGATEGVHGALPLLEFDADAIVRLRLDLALSSDRIAYEGRSGTVARRIAKAHVVVKEQVHPLRLRGRVPPQVHVQVRSLI